MHRWRAIALALSPCILVQASGVPWPRGSPSGIPAESLIPAWSTATPPAALAVGGDSWPGAGLATPQPLSEASAPLRAKVWPQDPLVPFLYYHRFLPDEYPRSVSYKTRLSEFRDHLERLYRAGFSLVPLGAWISGDLRAPAGRRPLLLAMDDVYFKDQIALTAEGEPDPQNSLGVLWAFSREHPDFGFEVALFVNLGDHLYEPEPLGNRNLPQVIAWGMDHGAIP